MSLVFPLSFRDLLPRVERERVLGVKEVSSVSHSDYPSQGVIGRTISGVSSHNTLVVQTINISLSIGGPGPPFPRWGVVNELIEVSAEFWPLMPETHTLYGAMDGEGGHHTPKYLALLARIRAVFIERLQVQTAVHCTVCKPMY